VAALKYDGEDRKRPIDNLKKKHGTWKNTKDMGYNPFNY